MKSFSFGYKKYMKHREDINMGWVNVRWGVPWDTLISPTKWGLLQEW
jgi:hypothetical protein